MSPVDPHDDPATRESTDRSNLPDAEQQERDIDLADLDALGVEGVVAQLRGPDTDLHEPVPRRLSPGRSPALSALIILVGAYLLVTMFADYRHWLWHGEPKDLGRVADLVDAEGMPRGLAGQYVRVSGTPDVRHRARLAVGDDYVEYLRIVEAGGSLFAAIPRDGEGITSSDKVEGIFEGRLVELDHDPVNALLDQYLREEHVVRMVDVGLEQIWGVLGTTHETTLATSRGPLELGADDRVGLVVESPDVLVQVGVKSFASAAKAEAAISALGYPYAVAPASSREFYSFVARLPKEQRTAVAERMNAALGVSPASWDVTKGVVILPLTKIFSHPAADWTVTEDGLSWRVDGDADIGLWSLTDDRFVPRVAKDGWAEIPRAWVKSARVEVPITVDPHGYVIKVGEKPPSTSRLVSVIAMWIVVLGLVAINCVSLVQVLRRRTSA